MTLRRIAGIVAVALVVAPAGVLVYFERVANPRVERELMENPDGERARRVMLLTLPSGRRIPVNYFREGDRVYAAADGGWSGELEGSDPAGDASKGDGHPVALLVRGEALTGEARAVRDDPSYTERIFAKLRPNAIKGFATLVEIRVDAPPR